MPLHLHIRQSGRRHLMLCAYPIKNHGAKRELNASYAPDISLVMAPPDLLFVMRIPAGKMTPWPSQLEQTSNSGVAVSPRHPRWREAA
mmetsp:Transcript_20789/g.48611  ORF Transcript_20789/g.48611 Transcript_20789/m.48611 type:complete len:88 (+) Transcript_20789:142-405(+)